MKFYNPFKPHIVKGVRNSYAIRKFSFNYMKWLYLDNIDAKFWWDLDMVKHARVDSEEEANEVYIKYMINSGKDWSKIL